MGKKEMTRREFIEQTSLTVSSAALLGSTACARESQSQGATGALKSRLPRRVLGRTKAEVSVLAFGCGSRFLMYRDEEEAARVLNHAIDLGINYLDTAINYGNGLSERRVGMIMKTRRREVWLATKVPERARTRDAALREVEESLKRLQTDHVDLLHIHSLGGEDDLRQIEAADGVLKALYELREQRVARFIGMTSHTDGAVMARAIERHDIDCVQMAMNPARAAKFEELALPAAKRKNLGVIVMKVTGQEKLLGEGAGKADVNALIRYALSLPGATTAVIGMPRVEHIEQNVAAAQKVELMSAPEMDRLRGQVAPMQASLEDFFRHHQDGGHLA